MALPIIPFLGWKGLATITAVAGTGLYQYINNNSVFNAFLEAISESKEQNLNDNFIPKINNTLKEMISNLSNKEKFEQIKSNGLESEYKELSKLYKDSIVAIEKKGNIFDEANNKDSVQRLLEVFKNNSHLGKAFANYFENNNTIDKSFFNNNNSENVREYITFVAQTNLDRIKEVSLDPKSKDKYNSKEDFARYSIIEDNYLKQIKNAQINQGKIEKNDKEVDYANLFSSSVEDVEKLEKELISIGKENQTLEAELKDIKFKEQNSINSIA